MEQPNYYSILPANVRYDKELKANEKLLFSEITALANKQGYCHAWNSYFADLYGVSKTTISNWINHLKERGYLKIVTIKDGKEIKKRKLYPNDTPVEENDNTTIKEKFNTPSKNDGEGIKEKLKSPIKENFKENITSINTTSKNKDDDDRAREKAFDDDPFTLANQAGINVNSGLHMPVFVDFISTLSAPVVCWAIRKTADSAQHPNWQYLLTVMKGLEANSVRTISQAEELSEQHQKASRQNNSRFRKPIKREVIPEWMKNDKEGEPKHQSSPEIQHGYVIPDDSMDPMPK